MTDRDDATPSARLARAKKWGVLALVAGVGAWTYARFGDALSLDYLAAQEEALRAFGEGHGARVALMGLLVYVAVTGLSLPGAVALTLAYGWFFGFAQGLLLVSFASTLGATLAFLLSRFLLRDTVERRFGSRLKGFNQALDREGAFYLLSLRLIPAVPFFVINLVMGLTPIRTWTFWWVSQVGMLPGTAVFVYAGSQFPSAADLAENGAAGVLTPQLVAALVVLGVFPFVVRGLLRRWRPARSPASTRG